MAIGAESATRGNQAATRRRRQWMKPATPASKAAAAHVPGSGTGGIMVVSIVNGALRLRSNSATFPPAKLMKLMEFQLMEPVKLLKAILKAKSGAVDDSTGKVPVYEAV